MKLISAPSFPDFLSENNNLLLLLSAANEKIVYRKCITDAVEIALIIIVVWSIFQRSQQIEVHQ